MEILQSFIAAAGPESAVFSLVVLALSLAAFCAGRALALRHITREVRDLRRLKELEAFDRTLTAGEALKAQTLKALEGRLERRQRDEGPALDQALAEERARRSRPAAPGLRRDRRRVG